MRWPPAAHCQVILIDGIRWVRGWMESAASWVGVMVVRVNKSTPNGLHMINMPRESGLFYHKHLTKWTIEELELDTQTPLK